MKGGPCKDCPDRVPACHDRCPVYKEWKSEHDKERESLRDSARVEIFGEASRRNWWRKLRYQNYRFRTK